MNTLDTLSTPIRFGVRVDTPLSNSRIIKDFGAAIEANGLDSFWIVDHPYPVKDYLTFLEQNQADAMVACTWVAAITQRITIGTAALIAPLRQLHLLGNTWRTLQEMSGGRCRAGLAVGWNQDEFNSLGVPFKERGKICDMAVTELREHTPAIPVLIAGGKVSASHGNLGADKWNESWLARVRNADGWLVRPQATPELVIEGLDHIGQDQQLTNRTFAVTHVNYLALASNSAVRKEMAQKVLGKTQALRNGPDYWLEDEFVVRARIIAMLSAGVTEIIAHPLFCTTEKIEKWADIAQEVKAEWAQMRLGQVEMEKVSEQAKIR